MQYKNYLKLTLFFPVLGPLLVWVTITIIELIANHYWVNDVQGFIFANLFGLVFFGIPYLLSVFITWQRMKYKTNKEAFFSVCYFPLLVVGLSLIYLVVFLLVTEGSRIFSDPDTLFKMVKFSIGMELLMGAPWVFLSLIILRVVKRWDAA